jgi:hypothetical protein
LLNYEIDYHNLSGGATGKGCVGGVTLPNLQKFFFVQQIREIFFHLTPKIMLRPQKIGNFGFLIKKMSLYPPNVG